MERHPILIVDDEPIVRESIRDWLKYAGYQVATSETAEEALKLIEKQDFSVMVLDIRLPGQSGLTLLKTVKARRPWIKSIIITAYPSEESTVEAKKLGAIDYLIKPIAPDDLEKLIRQTVDAIAPEPTIITPVKPEPVVRALKVKKSVFITKRNFKSFMKKLADKMEIIGVKSKQGKYVFDKIDNIQELCLDYDVTVNPPTRYFLPAKEVLLKYRLGEKDSVEPVIPTTPRVIVGVHPYDIKAMELIDEVYKNVNPDPNYTARRNNTVIIGVDCLNPASKSFAPSMGTNITENGFDLLLTEITNGYLVTIGTRKGADLITKYAEVRETTIEEIGKQKQARDKSLAKYKLELLVSRERMPRLLEESYDDPYWESRSKTCFSCGSCVMVCPTCFCFDVKEDMALNLVEGTRYRQWDGCMLVDFAKVATGENFRHDKASRFRHRIFRKGKYLLEKYGMAGCVGCGRCADACLADIASPVEAFNAIVGSIRAKEESLRIIKETRPKTELYVPESAELIKIDNLGAKEKAFTFRFADQKMLGHRPGQFVEVSIPGIGEAPISVSSSPTRGPEFQLAIRNVGTVTNAIHNLPQGTRVGIRGPFGNGFPLLFLEGKDILFVAGGIGLFPLRSLIQYVLDRRGSFGKAMLLFGARSPSERMFTEELAAWSQNPKIEFHETVDKGDDDWKGNVGVITTLIPKVEIDLKKTVAVVVGPPIMYRFVIVELKKRGLADENIIMSLERRMKCGVGKCGHCQINGVYACQEGPVFSLAQLRNLREAV
jgi:sulfite reductase subunit B